MQGNAEILERRGLEASVWVVIGRVLLQRTFIMLVLGYRCVSYCKKQHISHAS